jgi:NAD-dependent deacetylase
MTGNGISAESGVPLFDNSDGQWNEYKVQELATLKTLNQNPELFWKFFSWRRQQLENVKPNLAHYALVDMERLVGGFALLTQTIDNLHRVAGNKQLLELHGNLLRDRCSKCDQRYPAEPGEFKMVPTCKKCDGLLRPDVVLIDENIENKFIEAANKASAACEVFIAIGNSSIVEPAASLPYMAKANGAYVLEINPDETSLSSHANECIRTSTIEALPQLAMEVEKLFS